MGIIVIVNSFAPPKIVDDGGEDADVAGAFVGDETFSSSISCSPGVGAGVEATVSGVSPPVLTQLDLVTVSVSFSFETVAASLEPTSLMEATVAAKDGSLMC